MKANGLLHNSRFDDDVTVAVIHRDSDPLLSVSEDVVMGDIEFSLSKMGVNVISDYSGSDADRSGADVVIYRCHPHTSSTDDAEYRLREYSAPAIRIIDSVPSSRSPERLHIGGTGVTLSSYAIDDDGTFDSSYVMSELESVCAMRFAVPRHPLSSRMSDRILVIDLLGDLDPVLISTIDGYASAVNIDVISSRSRALKRARAIEVPDPFSVIGSYRYCLILSRRQMNTVNAWAASTQNTFILTPWNMRAATYLGPSHYFRGLLDVMEIMDQEPEEWRDGIRIQQMLGMNMVRSRSARKRRLLYETISSLTGAR